MNEIKISELAEAEEVNDDDLIPIVQGGVNKKVKAKKVGTGNGGGDSIEIIQKDGEASETNVYSAKAIDEMLEGETKQINSATLSHKGRPTVELESWKDKLVPLDTFIENIGDAFSTSAYGIKVNKDMTALISAQVSTYECPFSSQFSVKIVGSISGYLGQANSNTEQTLMSHTIPPIVRKIKAGEIIQVHINTQVAGTYTIIADNIASYLTIQEVSERVETTKAEGLVERRHNERGYYEKYADGTLKCWETKEFGTVDINTSFGALFVSKALTLDDFPVPFIDKPVLTKWLENGSTSAWLINGLPYSTTENPRCSKFSCSSNWLCNKCQSHVHGSWQMERRDTSSK